MVLEQIIKMVAEQFMIDENEISADTSFVDDLGADSLDVVELTMALEETFSLPDTPEDELQHPHRRRPCRLRVPRNAGISA